jgi:hypothetical protein
LYGSADTAGPFFVCLREADIELFRLLLGYARREINWAADLSDLPAYYTLPTDAQLLELWDQLDDLEGRLMAVVCIDDLVDALGEITTSLDALSCICENLLSLGQGINGDAADELAVGIDDGVIGIEDGVPDATLPTELDDACDAAQALWWFVYEYVTEIAIPLSDLALAAVVVLLLGKLGVIIAGVAEVFRLTGGQVMQLVSEIAAAVIGGAGAAIVNWLLAAKTEIVCCLYQGIVENDLDGAISCVHDLIDASDLPGTSKTGMKRGFSKTFLVFTGLFRDGAWAQDRVESGYCDDCELPAGCFDFCDENWEIGGCGTVENCILTNGCASGFLLAGRVANVGGNFTIGILVDKPFDAAYNFDIRVYQFGETVFAWKPITDSGLEYLETETTGVEEGECSVLLYGISGTETEYHYLCIKE